MASPAIAATTSLAVVAVGAAANLVASNKPLLAKTWDKNGGFIGLTNGHNTPRARTAMADPPAPSAPPSPPATAAPSGKPDGTAIGGATDHPAPPTPFGRFRKCRPTKLPGPPKTYEQSSTP